MPRTVASGSRRTKQNQALLEERVDQLASLSELSIAVARAESLDDACAAALDCLAKSLSATRASVLLFDASGVMRFRAWRGLSDSYRRATEGHSPWTPDTEDPAPVLVPDVADEPSLAGLRLTIEREGIRALGFFPLLDRGRLTGKFTIYFDQPHEFTASEVRLAQAIGAHVALEIARSKRESELQDRADATSVLAHVGDGVFQLGPDERVLLWNRGAAVITGVDEEQALQRPIQELILDWDRIRDRISVTDVPFAVGRRDALPAQLGERERWLVISGVASRDGVVYAFRDVTESERLEKVRRDFLATASHELRTPLSGVFGAAKTLMHRQLDESTRQSLLEVIDSQTDRLATILDELLYASRLDAGMIDIALDDCDVVPLAGEVIDLQRPRLSPNLTLSTELADDLPAVRCDPVRLRQVLVNLLDNAIKYSPDGGAIVVSLAPHPGTVRVSVADQGLGVPAGERERIFEKFYRLDPDLTRGVGGTGLGLYISRQYIDQMRGRLWLEPRTGRGSIFHIELPVAA
jgi:signal transduction histidine kinase